MRVAVPLFGTRVAPRCLIAREMVLAEIEQGEIVSRAILGLEIDDEDDLIGRLVQLGVGLLVCGGIRREFMSDLATNGVRVINNVAGEATRVLEVLSAGRLAPGYGLDVSPTDPLGPGTSAAAGTSGPPIATVDCLACAERVCLRGEACSRRLPLVDVAHLDPGEERILAAGRDVSAETDPRLCRIAELVHFALEMGYRRLGLAFCWEMFREVEVLASVLSRFFSVVPVCCRLGSAETTGARHDGSRDATRCRPDRQAALLRAAGTELNVVAGLCLGCDLLFASRSHAPVTTLFVRDRILAHNPVAAIYTRYHLDRIEAR